MYFRTFNIFTNNYPWNWVCSKLARGTDTPTLYGEKTTQNWLTSRFSKYWSNYYMNLQLKFYHDKPFFSMIYYFYFLNRSNKWLEIITGYDKGIVCNCTLYLLTMITKLKTKQNFLHLIIVIYSIFNIQIKRKIFTMFTRYFIMAASLFFHRFLRKLSCIANVEDRWILA